MTIVMLVLIKSTSWEVPWTLPESWMLLLSLLLLLTEISKSYFAFRTLQSWPTFGSEPAILRGRKFFWKVAWSVNSRDNLCSIATENSEKNLLAKLESLVNFEPKSIKEIWNILKIEKAMSKLEASFSVCYYCNIVVYRRNSPTMTSSACEKLLSCRTLL